MDPLELQRLLALPGVSIPMNGPTPDWGVASGIPQRGQAPVVNPGKMDKLPFYNPAQPLVEANNGTGVYEPVEGAPYENVAETPRITPAGGPTTEAVGDGALPPPTAYMGPTEATPDVASNAPVEGSWDSFMRRPGMGNALLAAGGAILSGKTPMAGLGAGAQVFGQSLEDRRRYDQGREDADLDRMLKAQIAQQKLDGKNVNKLQQDIETRKAYAGEMFDDPDSPEARAWIRTGKDMKGMSASEKKFALEEQERMDDLGMQRARVEKLMSYLPNMYHGAGAGWLGKAGTTYKDVGGSLIADPEKAKYTELYNKMIEPGAIKLMAETLKGATTNFEMEKFIKLMSHSDTSLEVKQQILGEMMAAIEVAEARARGERVPRYEFNFDKYYENRPEKPGTPTGITVQPVAPGASGGALSPEEQAEIDKFSN